MAITIPIAATKRTILANAVAADAVFAKLDGAIHPAGTAVEPIHRGVRAVVRAISTAGRIRCNTDRRRRADAIHTDGSGTGINRPAQPILVAANTLPAD